MTVNVTLQLADFISSFELDGIDEKVLQKVKIHLLDTLAVALSASDSLPVSRAVNGIPTELSMGSFRIWGRKERANLFHALRVKG